MLNLHWWYSKSLKHNFPDSKWEVEVTILGEKTTLEACEWTLRDPNDGWKPAKDAVYLGYGHLISVDGKVSNVSDTESQIECLAYNIYPNLTKFDMTGNAIYV
jgi:hypothetical protein